MIQDIQPHHYDNAYHPRAPRPGDRFFFYREGQTLMSAASGLPFTWEELPQQARQALPPCTYLFTIDQVGFFWLHQLPAGLEEKVLAVKDSAFRTLQPGWLAFASITASQLHRWYGNNRFCGRCG